MRGAAWVKKLHNKVSTNQGENCNRKLLTTAVFFGYRYVVSTFFRLWVIYFIDQACNFSYS